MANVYEGQPDARQSDDVAEQTSLFRPRYRALTLEEKALHDAIKNKAAELEELLSSKGITGRYHSLAITSLEQSIMWAVKGLTS